MGETITAQQLAELERSGGTIELIDVRSPTEIREVRVPFAKNLPLDRVDAEQIAAGRNGSWYEPIYVICQSGSRGSKACEKLAAAGLNATNIEGGTVAWVAAGLPVVRGKKAISLERQVRIAAGSLVLIGAVLGYFVLPLWIGLSGFIGGGLVFYGITDTCVMGMLLARMPWN